MVRRALMLRMCQELRISDLIASDGKNEFRILLTTPDAENATAIAERIEQLTGDVNAAHHAEEEPLEVHVEMEPPNELGDGEQGPCDPCEEHASWFREHHSS